MSRAGVATARARVLAVAGLALVVFSGRVSWLADAATGLPTWDQWLDLATHARLGAGHPSLAYLQATREGEVVFAARLVVELLLALGGDRCLIAEAVVGAALRSLSLAALLWSLWPLLGQRWVGAALALAAAGVLPLGPQSLLAPRLSLELGAGAAIVGLAVATGVRDAPPGRLAAASACFLLGLVSTRLGLLALVAATLLILLRALAAGGLDRRTSAELAQYLLFIVVALLLGFGERPPPARGLPLPTWQPLGAIIASAPVAVLVGRLIRARRGHDHAWRVGAFALWSSVLVAWLWVDGSLAPEHLGLLALAPLWGYAALAVLTRAGGGGQRRRVAPELWLAVCLVVLLAACRPGLRELRASRTARAEIGSQIQKGLRDGDWSGLAGAAATSREPPERYAVPPEVLPLLSTRHPALARLLPELLQPGAPSSWLDRLARLVARTWPVWLIAGATLLLAAFRGRAPDQ